MNQTTSFDQLLEWTVSNGYDPRLFQTWIPSKHFVTGYFQNSSITAIRGGDEIYALAIGSDPLVTAELDSFSIARVAKEKYQTFYQPRHEWDAYAVSSSEFKKPVDLIESTSNLIFEVISDSKEIDGFIDTHAPDSSVRSGNEEVISWVSIRQKDELLALAALCQWQSGEIVLSSVGVHSGHRNKGLGKLITAAATEIGLSKSKHVALGVLASNTPAKKVYESLGYTLLGEFAAFSRRDTNKFSLDENACCDY